MWNLPRLEIRPVLPALAGDFLTTGPLGKSSGSWIPAKYLVRVLNLHTSLSKFFKYQKCSVCYMPLNITGTSGWSSQLCRDQVLVEQKLWLKILLPWTLYFPLGTRIMCHGRPPSLSPSHSLLEHQSMGAPAFLPPPPGRPPKPPHCNAHGHGLQHMPALETPATVLFL